MRSRLLPFILWLSLCLGFIAWATLRTIHVGRMILPRSEAAAIAIAIVVAGSLLCAWAWMLAVAIARRLGVVRGYSWVERPAARLILLALLVIAILLFGYGRFLEPRWIARRSFPLGGAPPAGQEPVRVVAISDLHAERWGPPWSELAEEVNSLDPDLILFLGDTINRPAGLPTLRRSLAAMRARHGKLAVRGNWDVWYWHGIPLLEGTGFRWLDDERRSLEIRGQRLELAGLRYADQRDGRRGEELLRRSEPGSWRILLYHTPDLVLDVPSADLYLCGHTHGGQIAIPFYGALVTLSKHGKRFERGMGMEGGTTVYVHPGIGVEPVLPVRLGVRPEVTLFLLGARAARQN
jgi:predicted MPP superfamily phosphohydrolase